MVSSSAAHQIHALLGFSVMNVVGSLASNVVRKKRSSPGLASSFTPGQFYTYPPVHLAILAVLVTYGHLSLIRPSYAFLMLLIGYVVLAIGLFLLEVLDDLASGSDSFVPNAVSPHR